MNTIYLIVRGAYNRDYKSEESVMKAWDSNKDFMILTATQYGRYINKQDFERYSKIRIKFYYNDLEDSFTLSRSE